MVMGRPVRQCAGAAALCGSGLAVSWALAPGFRAPPNFAAALAPCCGDGFRRPGRPRVGAAAAPTFKELPQWRIVFME